MARRIVVFSSLWPTPAEPHAGIFIQQRTVALARRGGVDVEVVAPVPWFPRALARLPVPRRWRDHARVPRRHDIDGIDVRRPRYVITPRIGMRWYGYAMFRGTLPLLRRMHAERPIDVLDAHFLYPDGDAAVRAGAVLGVPVSVTAHGSDVTESASLRHCRPRFAATLDGAARTFAVSGDLASRLGASFPGARPARVVRYGVDRGTFHQLSRELARRAVGLTGAGALIVAAGNLIPRKGLDLVIDAFARHMPRREGEAPSLAIVGGGPEDARLRSRVASLEADGVVAPGAIRFAGPRPHQEMARWFAAADVSVLGSLSEGCPNVVIESLACGTPVVAAALACTAELVRSEDDGILVNENDRDPAVWGAAMRRALDRPWDRDGIARRGGARSWDDAASEWLAAVEDRDATPARH